LSEKLSKNFLKVSKLILDKRNSLSKLHKIVSDLQGIGYSHEDVIPIEDVEYFIEQNCGLDSRTIRKYLKLLVKHDFLKPASKTKVSTRNFVLLRTKRAVSLREYSITKGYSYYRFGSKAKRSRQSSITETPKASITISEGSGKICVCSREEDIEKSKNKNIDKNFLQGKELEKTVLEVVSKPTSIETKERINNNNNNLCDTHIFYNNSNKQLTKLEHAILYEAKPLGEIRKSWIGLKR